MTPPPFLFQALLRPAVLQILRATGFHATRPAVLESVTDLAAAYLAVLCRATAQHAAARRLYAVQDGLELGLDPAELGPTVTDVRMALEEAGALGPERALEDQALRWPPPIPPETGQKKITMNGWPSDGQEPGREDDHRHQEEHEEETGGRRSESDQEEEEEDVWLHNEDMRGVEEFVAWFTSSRMLEMQALVAVDGEPEPTDYLNALKKKHNKTGEDSKYLGTILGKANDVGEVLVEGGEVTTLQSWTDMMHRVGGGAGETGAADFRADMAPPTLSPSLTPVGSQSPSLRPPSSGLSLSSVGDRVDGMEMDMT